VAMTYFPTPSLVSQFYCGINNRSVNPLSKRIDTAVVYYCNTINYISKRINTAVVYYCNTINYISKRIDTAISTIVRF
jgi:hypothetical protein